MIRPASRFISLCAVATFSFGCAGASKLDFTAWGRAFWQRPDDVIEALAIPPGATVADLGAGKGYFTGYLADAVGPDGTVYAVEVQTDLVEDLQQRFANEPNIHAVPGSFDDPLLPDRQMDLIVVVNTFHHIADRIVYFNRLLYDLAPGGRVAIIEQDADLNGVLGAFVPAKHASRATDVLQTMRAAGYRRVAHFDMLPIQIFEIYSEAP